MEIWRSLKGRYLDYKRQQAETRRIQALHFATDSICDLYISGQINLTQLSGPLRSLRREASGLEPVRQQINRAIFEVSQGLERNTDEIPETYIKRILAIVNATPEEERKMRSVALRTAREYWEKRLHQPDLPADEMILGHRRITRITAKLEELNPPPPQHP